MKTSVHSTLITATEVIVTLLYFHRGNSADSLQNNVSIYNTEVNNCSSRDIINRQVLQVRTKGRGKTECLIQCTSNTLCELVVYQEFANGSTSCTKLSSSQSDSPTTLDVSTSVKCVAMYINRHLYSSSSSNNNTTTNNSSSNINRCLNEGQMYMGICLCQKGFTGEACEYNNPSFCNVEWKVAAAKDPGYYFYDSTVVPDFDRSNPKIKIRDTALNVVSVMRGMDADSSESSVGQLNWYLATFPFFEKVAWNKFAAKPQRQFKHFLDKGEFQLLSLNGSLKKYTFKTGKLNSFSFISPLVTRFAVKRNMPNDWTMLSEDLSKGHELYGSTWTGLDEEKQEVVKQSADRYLNIFIGKHFVNPPETFNFKYVLGIATYTVITYIGQSLNYETSFSEVETDSYLNPCWTRMTENKNDFQASDNGWTIFGTYLRLGNDVRVKVGPTYHTVLEVIQVGELYSFLLAPFVSQRDSSAFTREVYGVRSLISSTAMYEACTHQIEEELIIKESRFVSPYTVIWFVDTRKWIKVLVVSSNSSVLEGSVTDLASGVTKGSDVRVWIQWLRSGVSRFLDTHMSSVTDDFKVSTESIVTWRTTTDTEVRLSSACDLQYILVTSDGHLEILTFNLWTPATSVVHSNVMITWFLA